ncbi:TetR/AcrR family transcriptional regulator [Nonomuraea sediminis]|uniref:TetR/AcrR family transcriptional regulator n=1 Tax=Nonomuraea sediminis TaxID=2835864 RepID=UPI001BDC01AE|nr:TetR/AcrR family transcriptional regulator [Nonomuraea sediminis]
MRDRKAERHQSTRAEILAVAWKLAATEGLAGLTLRDVAREVGMRAPSLYSYFAAKHAIYDAMFAQGCREYLEGHAKLCFTGDPLTDIKIGMRFFVGFCTANPVRYQLLFQRTIPGFEPTPETFALSVAGLGKMRDKLAEFGITDPAALDLLTAIGTGLTDQQISNDPGGDRWTRLVDEAMEMYYAHISDRLKASDQG